MDLPSGYVKIAIENCHLLLIFSLKIVIFHSYVSLPEGIRNLSGIYNGYGISQEMFKKLMI